jgi:uncharacterized protein DUF3846
MAETITVLMVPAAGPVEVVTVERDAGEFRRLIGGGWLTCLESAGRSWSAWMDEDGAAHPVNERATGIAVANGWIPAPGDALHGPVFFAGPPDENGNSRPVPEFFVARVRALYGEEFAER